MKKLNNEQMENIAGGYCDSTIYALTGICTNPGCIFVSIYNNVAGTAGLPDMYCAL